MADNSKPRGLIGVYQATSEPSVLTNPYDLKVTYDPNAGGTNQNINGVGFNSLYIGAVKTIYPQFIKPTAYSESIFGQTNLLNKNRFVLPSGLLASGFGQAKIKNVTDQLFPPSMDIGASGRPTIYNLRQYVLYGGLHSAVFGTAYMQGGVKFVNTYGLNALAFPTPKVVNTRANQEARPDSIAPPTQQVSNPNVSPRHIRPAGIIAWSFGTPWVQRNPSPKGFTNDSYGNAWVSHSPRYLTPDWIQGFQAGYPKAFDPTQKIRHEGSPHIPGGIFGDIGIKNTRRVVSVGGEDQSRYGDWTEIHSNLINIGVHSFDSNVFGTDTVWNKTPSVIPKSWDSASFGTTFISDRVRRVIGRGIEMAESQRFGIHTLSKPPEIKPGAISALSFGNTWISNKRRNLTPSGFNSLQFNGAPIVWFRYRYVGAIGVNFSIVAAPKIEHGLRNLVANGSSFNVFGTPIVWFRVRSIKVSSIFREFESKHLVGGTQHIRPDGFDAARFGERIIPEIQGVYAQGFNSQGFSELNQIELHTRWVRASGFLSFGQQTSDRYGTAKIWNKRQYIQHSYDSGDGLNPGGFGQWNAIANRNRRIRVIGFDAARFGYHQIYNNARPLLPLSFMPGVFGTAMISDRVRRIRLEGMEAPYMSGWGRVFNAAHLISALGGKHEVFGSPSVLNTRREYRWVGAFESMQFGQPMIAFRIRNIHIESRYSIAPIYLPLPKFDLHTRYIEPQGPETDAFGGPSLHIKWNIITTRWSHRELFGDPFVRNLTPELKQRGANLEEFGKPAAHLQWEKYTVEGFGNEIFGRLNIAYRDRSMMVTGFNAFGIGQVKVIKTGAPPYSLQNITLDWSGEGERPESYSGYGIEPPKAQVPNPSLKTNVIFASGFVATAFGSHHTQSNGILVQPGMQQFAIGNHFVGLKNREIIVSGINNKIIVSNPRLSPHTIYAVTEAPEQAKANHPNQDLHVVDGRIGKGVGYHTITLKHRNFSVGAGNQSNFGNGHKIDLRRRYINLKDFGFRSQRIGFHVVGPFDQNIMQFDSNDMQSFGQPSLNIPYGGAFFIKPNGLNSPVLNRPTVEFFNRTIKAVGSNHLQMGTRKSGDTPFMWQGLRVGELIRGNYGGFENEAFGNTFISLKVRNVEAQGFESFVMEYDYTQFDQRMRVIRKELPKPSLSIQPVGVDALVVTVPNIKPAVHYIRPDGNADQYRKGAF